MAGDVIEQLIEWHNNEALRHEAAQKKEPWRTEWVACHLSCIGELKSLRALRPSPAPVAGVGVVVLDALTTARQFVSDSTLCDRRTETLNMLDSAIYAARAQGVVPEGWQLVPVKPTQEMVDAALATQDIYTGRGALAAIGYKAMLAAAPAAQGGGR